MKTRLLRLFGIPMTLAIVASLFVLVSPVNAVVETGTFSATCTGLGSGYFTDIPQGPSGTVGESGNLFQTYEYAWGLTGDLEGTLVLKCFIVRHYGNIDKGLGSESNTHFEGTFTGSFMGYEGTMRTNTECMGYPEFSGPLVMVGTDGELKGLHINGVSSRGATSGAIDVEGTYKWDNRG